ncbi:hypothetical protein VOLCADRAFT_59054 [Volvox carteri f. nagariensis]|uniref:Band 7 domain-containing protein n=1 Tax=Volvox carteri f. nagariensis TaxID=3068 RepID=D8TS67_VOLCA|nr:uncharacterized protein VOLCADRAFT_59054 [Volvox carteri f. nagariensis]EFJ49641.1 hypothetical protein VOLCADRAFT_59054 [Volvox carteri f. nagariensis]|eukprot:XP_002949148.1 hypothetical protein VOLCADRAFT_59054 [Volvox carteri f. nagariensis]
MNSQSGPSNRVPLTGDGLGPADRRVTAPSPLYLNLPIYISIIAIAVALFIKTAVHQIPEGHVGVYWRGGVLLHRTTSPGIRVRLPLLDTFEAIQTTMQTDRLTDILCGTKGGVTITFDNVEVVNRLRRDLVYETIRDYGVQYDRIWIYDKARHEISQLCSSRTLEEVYITQFDQIEGQLKDALQADCNRYAPGIEIIAVRVSKPTIPQSVLDNYVAMEVERTRAMVALERQRVMEREAEAERIKEVSQARRVAETSAIQMQQLLAEKEAQRARAEIDNDIFLAQQKARADAEKYRLEREAEGLRSKLTPQYLEYELIQALTNNTKIFVGDRLPSRLLLDARTALRGVFAALETTEIEATAAEAESEQQEQQEQEELGY